MTTAARPTFDPARGYDGKAPTLQYSLQHILEQTGLTTEELDKIDLKEELLKAEREPKRRSFSIKEFDKLEADERQRQEEALAGNPILIKVFSVKRRWDDDVIFKNQARGVDDRSKKRFINDTLRSDPIVQQRNSGEMEKGQSARARLG
ncbi:9850_t:CDS:2, partial [Funneliformis geosporum]